MNFSLRFPAVLLVIVCTIVTGCSHFDEKPEENDPDSAPFAGYEVEHRTAPPLPGDLQVPATVAEAAWVWEGPETSRLLAVHATPSGAVLELDNGVIGLDTLSGETAWSFLLPEVSGDDVGTDAAVSPDGTVAAFTAGRALVLLDTATGEELLRSDRDGTGTGSFSIDGAGLVHSTGLLTAQAGPELRVTLTSWEEGTTAWENTLPACSDSQQAVISSGVVTARQAAVVFECPGESSTVVGLDLDDGEEMWRFREGRDYHGGGAVFPPASSEDLGFGAVGDLLVLQNISHERGTVVINAEAGRVVADALPSTPENALLRVLPDGYLAAISAGAEEGPVTYEFREFDGTVRNRLETTTDVARGHVNNFLVLDEALLKLRMVEEGEEQDMAVFDWESGEEYRVTVPVGVDTTEILSVAQVDQEVGPSTFRAVPGAVLLREYPASAVPRLAGFR
ncbi:PQQ-binding-like beta-propeller repeat protein [Nocardiopsis sp. CC223A]|uniref:outer membrane protein assembly factor BamB family protein n=1 Tax=Nocardiopsis sp. CC223A TaxID=3044051 RepID=UPI00278BDEA4|nr:PQQ-binding-like beta-propeller repeat protein [Nocardiopsis sp. CC223A]